MGRHMSVMASHITLQLTVRPIVQANINENIKTLYYWPLLGESIGHTRLLWKASTSNE